MKGERGKEFNERMKGIDIRLKVILIKGNGEIEMGVKEIKDGEIDFMEKKLRKKDILDEVKKEIRKERKRMREEKNKKRIIERYKKIKKGEREVLKIVVKGIMKKKIEDELDVEEVKVKVRR